MREYGLTRSNEKNKNIRIYKLFGIAIAYSKGLNRYFLASKKHITFNEHGRNYIGSTNVNREIFVQSLHL